METEKEVTVIPLPFVAVICRPGEAPWLVCRFGKTEDQFVEDVRETINDGEKNPCMTTERNAWTP